MRLRYIFYSIVISLSLTKDTYGQDLQLNLTNYSSRDGLSFDYINQSAFDNMGFLWVATDFGLNKFDNRNISRFYSYGTRSNPTMSGDKVKAICCDSILIWLAIEHGGVNCYFEEADHFVKYLHDPLNPNSLISNNGQCLYLASGKKLFIGTDHGLSIFDRKASSFTNLVYHPVTHVPLNITALTEAGNGNMWIGTNGQGLLYYDRNEGKIYAAGPALPSGVRINELLHDEKIHCLWMATSAGIWRSRFDLHDSITSVDQPFKELATASATCIKKNNPDELWIGTETEGVFVWRKEGGLKHYTAEDSNEGALVSNQINHIDFGNNQSVWLSTPRGLEAYFPDQQHFPFFNTGISIDGKFNKCIASGISIYKKYIVAATEKGISVTDTNFFHSRYTCLYGGNKKLVSFSGVQSIGDAVFVTGSDGLYQLLISDKTCSLIRPPLFNVFRNYIKKRCSQLLKVSDSDYWMVLDGGVCDMNIAREMTRVIYSGTPGRVSDLSNNTEIHLFQGNEGRILITHGNEIAVYNQSGKVLAQASDESFYDRLTGRNIVTDMYDDAKSLWIATDSRGLYRCDSNLNITARFSTENGLCSNSVAGIQPDEKGNLWLTTKNGISVFDTAAKRFTSYSREQGLPSNEFGRSSTSTAAHHTLYFTTPDAIVQVRPGKWTLENPPLLYPVVTKATIGTNILAPNDLSVINEMRNLEGNYGNNIELSFGVLMGFLNSSQYVLRYKLDKDTIWHEIAMGTDILFSRLSPGTHQLYLIAVAKSQRMAGNILNLSIYINPVFYQHWWFILFMLIIVAAFIYLVYAYRINQIVKLYTVRNKIARDLHDEVGATLSGIAMYSHLAGEQVKTALPVEAQNSLRIIQQSAGEMVNKLNDIVWMVNPAKDSMQKLLERLEEYAGDMASSKNMRTKIVVPESLSGISLPLEMRRNIYLFCKEAINNAAKYSGGTFVELHVEQEGNKIQFTVRDDGVGFDIRTIKPGNGLNNMQKRADEAGATLLIRSIKGEGAELSMKVRIT